MNKKDKSDEKLKLSIYLNNWLKWFFREAWFVVYPVILPFFILAVTLLFFDSQQGYSNSFYFFGIALRLSGFFILLIGINKKLRDSAYGGIGGLLKKLWENRPNRNKEVIGRYNGGSTQSPAKLDYECQPILKGSESEIEILEKRVDCLESNFNNFKTELNKHREFQENRIGESERELGKKIKENTASIENLKIGNIKWETFGVILMIEGFLMSSLNNELAWLVNLIC